MAPAAKASKYGMIPSTFESGEHIAAGTHACKGFKADIGEFIEGQRHCIDIFLCLADIHEHKAFYDLFDFHFGDEEIRKGKGIFMGIA